MEGQATFGFRLLRYLKDQGDSLEIGDGRLGDVSHYYWVLAASENGELSWASDHDYQIYLAPIAEFKVPDGCNLPACLPPVPD